MTPITQDDIVTSNCPISPTPEQAETAASEKVDVAVASGLISQAHSKEHSDNVNHQSQQQLKQECTSPQNEFPYKIGTIVVLRNDKVISD